MPLGFLITEWGHSLTCIKAIIICQKLNSFKKNKIKIKTLKEKKEKTKPKSYDLFKNWSITL